MVNASPRMAKGARRNRSVNARVERSEVPPPAVDAMGLPEHGNEQERITVIRPAAIPGLEVWKAERSLRYWRVFHDRYAFCTTDTGWSGISAWRYRGQEFSMAPHTQQIFEPGMPHHTFRIGGPPANFHVLLLQPALLEQTLGGPVPHFAVGESIDPALQLMLRKVVKLAETDPIAAEIALAEYSGSLVGAVGETGQRRAARVKRDWRVERVREFVHDQFAEPVRLRHLASTVDLSPERIVTLFREWTGLPFRQYLIAVRLQHALALMRRGVHPSAAAIDSGFYDLSHMGREMKRRLGFSPSHYFAATSGRNDAGSTEA